MNDMTLALHSESEFESEFKPEFEYEFEQPFAALFAIEQQVFHKRQVLQQQRSKKLDVLESGTIKFNYKQSFDPHEAAIHNVQPADDKQSYIVTGSLITLTGANGVLPNHYSETVAKTLRDKNTVFKDFLDIFNHRVNSLMYRSWAKYRLDTDKAYQANVEQYQSTIDLMMSVFAGGAIGKTEPSDLYFSGLSYATTLSADKLSSIILELTGLQSEVIQFKGKWIEVSEDQLSCAQSKSRGQQFNQLGVNTMLGRRCWDLSSGFEVELEVEDGQTFAGLMPDGETHQLLRKTIKNLVGENFEFNFKLKVKEAHCQRVRLSNERQGSKLGANAWMGQNSSHDNIINYFC